MNFAPACLCSGTLGVRMFSYVWRFKLTFHLFAHLVISSGQGFYFRKLKSIGGHR